MRRRVFQFSRVRVGTGDGLRVSEGFEQAGGSLLTWKQWTPEAKAYALESAREGYSGTQIARRVNQKFDMRVTRNAAIGVVNRAGLAIGGGQSRATKAQYIERCKRDAPTRQVSSPLQTLFASLTIEPPMSSEPEIVIPLAERKTLAELEPGDCRWPFSDPRSADFHFCNRLQVGTESRARKGVLSYCESHAKRAFQAPQPRRHSQVPASEPVRIKEDA